MAQRSSGVPASFRRVSLPPWWALLPIMLLFVVGASMQGAQAARAQARALRDSPGLSIINPAGLQGPAGTNVTARITGSHAGHVFALAYAPASPGCIALGASSATLPQVTVGNDGSVQFSFAWPADSGTGSFDLCAQDQNSPLSPVLQSQQAFTVLSTTPPAISIQPAPQPTPTGTAASSSTATSQNGYTTGESVIVQGTGFLPGGTSVEIGLASTPTGDSQIISQGPVNADTSGNFSTTVTLPQFRTGSIYIQALTTDGGSNQPPSLLASTPITIGVAPTPTVTPSPTATAAASPTPGGNGGTGGSSDNSGTLRLLGIAGLGSFSVLLLLVGTALLISAGRMTDGAS